MLAHTLEADTRSHQKKATLTKMKGTLLLKWLTALCVLECVGAQGAGSDTPSPSLPSTDEYEALHSFTAKGKLNALVKASSMLRSSRPS